MTGFAAWELQKSLKELLTADSSLSTQVSGIYDHVPAGTPFPYVTIGEAQTTDRGSSGAPGSRVISVLRVFSRQPGRRQATDIMARLHALLHLQSLSVAGHHAVLTRFLSAEVDVQPDGLTQMGTIRFETLLEPG